MTRAASTSVFIANFNRLDTTRGLVGDLLGLGFSRERITIVDNASTYPPLLEWYASQPCTVVREKRNLAKRCLATLFRERRLAVPREPYVYTDSDIRLPGVPADVVDVLARALEAFPRLAKAGPGLRIDDIPDEAINSGKVRAWEAQWWTRPLAFEHEAYEAFIDSTFALYRGGAMPGTPDTGIRVCGAYLARHEPWYYRELPPDELWLAKCKGRTGGYWSQRYGQAADKANG